MSSEDSDELPAPDFDNLAEEDTSLTDGDTSQSSTTLTPFESVTRSQTTPAVTGGQLSTIFATTTATRELSTISTSMGSTSNPSYIAIPPTARPGSLVITQPAQSFGADPPLYKIARGTPVTFGWKFSDVLATPTYLTVAAIAGAQTYAVGATGALPDKMVLGSKSGEPGVIDGTATQVVWDLDAYQSANPQAQLLPTVYTLSIWDDRGPEATFRPGYLLPNAQLKFSLYTPQAYHTLNDGWTCTTCNGASTMLLAHPASVSLVVTILIAFLSGFHLLRGAPARD